MTQRRSRGWLASLIATLAFFVVFAAVAVLGTLFGDSGLPLGGRRVVLIFGVAAYLALPVLVCWLLVGALVRWLGGDGLRTTWAVVLGALLSLAPMAVGILIFRDGDDPKSFAGYLEFWRRVPSAFWLGALPYLVSGAVFGWLLGRSRRLRPAA